MAKPLARFQDLLSQGWNDYLAHWNRTVQMTLWLLIMPVLQLAIITVFRPGTFSQGQTIIYIFEILQALVSLWIFIRLVRWYLSEFKQDPSYDHNSVKALRALPSLIFAAILKSLAVMAGVFLLFFPGIWLAILLNFTEFSVLEDGKRGIEALRASANLVRGRWWGTFGRLFGMILVFLIIGVIGYMILSFLVIAFSGLTITETMASNLADPNNLRVILIAYSTDQVINSVIQAVLLPLLFAWQIRLFHNLKETA